jgi:cytochrome c
MRRASPSAGSRSRWLILLIALGLASGCGGRAAVLPAVPDGDPARGQVRLRDHGCTACHRIPGIVGPQSYAGPPLTAWAARHYIAGSLPNNPDNLIAWLRNPQAIEPGTAMPNLDLTEQDARDISAYLFTLRE